MLLLAWTFVMPFSHPDKELPPPVMVSLVQLPPSESPKVKARPEPVKEVVTEPEEAEEAPPIVAPVKVVQPIEPVKILPPPPPSSALIVRSAWML